MTETDPARELLRLVNGYQVSQTIDVAATLGIADLLKDGPRAVDVFHEDGDQQFARATRG
jgi:hypothetical protein